jgi:hypothetical protein
VKRTPHDARGITRAARGGTGAAPPRVGSTEPTRRGRDGFRLSWGVPRPPSNAALAAFLAAGLFLLAAGRARALSPADVRGTYRLQGTARLDARPFPARDEELHADAVLAPGAAPGQLRVRLSGEGLSCELIATLGADGALAFAPGQRCPAELQGGEAEGKLEGRLLSGSGRVSEEALSLELAFSLSGAVRLRAGGALDSVGGFLALPGTGGSDLPVRGEVRGRAQGRRDRSRAAGG